MNQGWHLHFAQIFPILVLLLFEGYLLKIVMNYDVSIREDFASVNPSMLVNELGPFWFGHPGKVLLASG